jgi:hypothetical protein
MRILLTIVISLIAMCGCSNDQVVYAYVVTKSISEENKRNEWRPVMRVAFLVGEKKVMTEVAGLLDEYESCSIINKNNWECQYTDGAGRNRFGFNEGKYWKDPVWSDDIKYVSRWQYNVIRCNWYQFDNGKIKGTASCLRT